MRGAGAADPDVQWPRRQQAGRSSDPGRFLHPAGATPVRQGRWPQSRAILPPGCLGTIPRRWPPPRPVPRRTDRGSRVEPRIRSLAAPDHARRRPLDKPCRLASDPPPNSSQAPGARSRRPPSGYPPGYRPDCAALPKGHGQGRVLGADAAQAQGMVDGVATFGEVVRKTRRHAKSSARPKASRLAYVQRAIEIL